MDNIVHVKVSDTGKGESFAFLKLANLDKPLKMVETKYERIGDIVFPVTYFDIGVKYVK